MTDEPGYLVAGHCWSCGTLFGFHPEKVPSIPINEHGEPAIGGERMPLCEDCITAANAARTLDGGPLWRIPEGAYGPVPGLPE